MKWKKWKICSSELSQKDKKLVYFSSTYRDITLMMSSTSSFLNAWSYLYVDLIVSGSVYWTIQAKTHYGYSSVNIESTEGERKTERGNEKQIATTTQFAQIYNWSVCSSPHLILSLVPLYPHRLSTCWNLLMLHSSPLRQQRGLSM